MVMGQRAPYKLVDELPANEFYHLEGKPFSKSDNWFIDLDDFLTHFSVDQLRYALSANAPESHDSSFCYRDFQQRCNAELLGKYGNLANRVLVFTQQHCGGKVPSLASVEKEDRAFLTTIDGLRTQCAAAYDQFQLRKAAATVMEMAAATNAYFDRKKPWRARKDPALTPSLHATIGCSLFALEQLALISFPILPDTAQTLWRLLGHSTSLATAS